MSTSNEEPKRMRIAVRKGHGPVERPPTLTWAEFLAILGDNSGYGYELDAFVVKETREPLSPAEEPHTQAVSISKAVWEVTGYRFM